MSSEFCAQLSAPSNTTFVHLHHPSPGTAQGLSLGLLCPRQAIQNTKSAMILKIYLLFLYPFVQQRISCDVHNQTQKMCRLTSLHVTIALNSLKDLREEHPSLTGSIRFPARVCRVYFHPVKSVLVKVVVVGFLVCVCVEWSFHRGRHYSSYTKSP